MQPSPHVGVKRKIQRPHLVPQPVGLSGEIVGGHVIFRPPHCTRVGEPEFARALIGQLYVTFVRLAHGWRDGVPTNPRLFQFLGISAGAQDAAEFFQIETLVAAWRAELAFAVGALHRGSNLREFGRLRRIGWSGNGER
jgi:hypothetical protein